MDEIRDAAIGEAERMGWHVHPLRGKIPLIEDWPRRASADPGEVAAMFDAHPGSNVGLQPGASNLVIFDDDSADARAEAHALGLLDIPTLRTITARGRHHFFVRGSDDPMPPMRVRHGQRVNGATPALEVKCDGANVAIPPSVHPSGHRYAYEDPEAKPAPCPADVWALLCALVAVPRDGSAPDPQPPPRSTLLSPDDSVIAAFNAAHSVEQMLAEYGYKRRRGPRPRFLAPQSTSGLAGVVVLEDRAYSHHATDTLADGHAHDAFDLYRIFEHAGDVTAAVRAASAALGMTGDENRFSTRFPSARSAFQVTRFR